MKSIPLFSVFLNWYSGGIKYYFSGISAFMVIEILYLFLTVGKKDAYENISRHEQSIADDKF